MFGPDTKMQDTIPQQMHTSAYYSLISACSIDYLNKSYKKAILENGYQNIKSKI